MRKQLIITFLTIISYALFGQKSFPYVEKNIIEDRLFQGRISDQYPITIYLKFEGYSNYSSGSYSVKGWYYYDKIKTPIPLVGLYDGSLTLYNFQDSSQVNKMLHFSEMKSNHWEDMDYYKALEAYIEKFVITDTASSWTNKDKKLSLKVSHSNFNIRKTSELLKLNPTTTFDLNNFGGWEWNFKLIASHGNNILLKFSYASQNLKTGFCGAGQEKGFLQLSFDKNNNLESFKEVFYESCNLSINLGKEEKISASETKFNIERNQNRETFTIDFNKAIIHN